MITLALKYRPRVLSDLVGQEASVRALTNALKRAKAAGGAIHHQAFLFAGVRGTGKTSTARILARALNCEEGPTAQPCGTCPACLASETPDQNMDIVEIDAASRSSVEDARALREQVQTRPAFCRYRVYIIDEVHMMSRSAFDALLKILEEPPPHAVFVLATTELQDVPDTIKSRVQIFPFRLIPPGMVEGRLRWVCEQEGVTFDEAALRLLAEAGQGSMRDALTTLDRVVSAGDGHVAEALVRDQLGIVPAVRVQGVLEALLTGDCGAILDHCRALSDLGSDWVSFWRELMLAFRDRMEAEVRQGSGPQDVLRFARMLQLLLARERDLRDSSLPDVVVELALLTAAQLPHLAPLDALLKATPAAGAAAGRNPAVGVPMAPPPPRAAARPPEGPSRPFEPRQAESRVSDSGPAMPPPAPLQSSAPPAPEARSAAPQPAAPQPAAPQPAAPSSAAPPTLVAPPDPRNLEQLRQAVGETLRQAPGGLPRTLGALAHMATSLAFDGRTLHWHFAPNVRNTVQDLERELANPHLLEALRPILPGLASLSISFDAGAKERPEDLLRGDPVFQRLLQETGGEVVDVRTEN
ncbi:MAG TPA: DNA polymerase III subunit gamma/tau [Holophaga sp.]|nr:DNA polymerase III subunit gamma/tau [Holophaga sp.]